MENTDITELRRIRARINQANKLVGSWDSAKTTTARGILTEEIAKLDAMIKRLTEKAIAPGAPAGEL